MLLWITFAALAAVISLILTRATGPSALPPAGAGDVAVYKDQLAELDADAARGLIPRDEAETARAEIARRLLKAADHEAPVASKPPAVRSATLLAFAAAGIPLLSLALYLRLGSPGLPARPLAARIAAPVSTVDTPAALNDMLAKVEAELRAHPEDARGWTVIAPIYLSQGRAGDAANAYGRALLYGGETLERLAGLAQSNLVASNGIVGDISRKAYLRALKLDPAFPEGRFWLAVYEEQNGRPASAIDAYRKISAEVPAASPWHDAAEERLTALTDPNAPKSPSAPASAPAAAAAADDPARHDPSPAEFVAAAQKLPPEMRDAMIGGRMIPKAQDAVAKNPKDVAAWSRIVTGHAALGHATEARAALDDARKAAAGDAPMLKSLEYLAQQLGLNS